MMTKTYKKIGVFAAVLWALSLQVATANTATEVEGTVYYLDDGGNQVSISNGDFIPEGRIVYTGQNSSVKITKLDGSIRRLGSSSRLVLVRTITPRVNDTKEESSGITKQESQTVPGLQSGVSKKNP